MKDTKSALLWITEILDRYNVQYQISGGFAARLYGCDRELADIDIDYTESRLEDFFEEIRPHIIWGPKRYKDDSFDVPLVTLKYEGQEIELAGCETGRHYDRKGKRWVLDDVNFDESEEVEIFGRCIKVIARKKLIEYKLWTRREVDLYDLKQLGEL